MHLFARVTAAAAALATALVGAAPAVASPPVQQQGGDGAVEVTAGAVEGPLAVGDDLELALSVANGTSEPLADASVDISVTYGTVDTRFALNAWLDDQPVYGSRLVESIDMATVTPGTSFSTTVTVDAESLGFDEQTPAGAYGIRVTIGDATTSSLITVGEPENPAITLSAAAPISTPASRDGLLSREQLSAQTSNVGSLARQLGIVEQYPISVGIDPMVETSMEALPGMAPAGAWSWLDAAHELEHLYHLPYAMSDVLAQLAAGAEPLMPLGYPDASADGGIVEALPTILSSRGVIDATERAVDADLLAQAAGHGVPVITTDQLADVPDRTASAHVSIGGESALVAESDVQRLLTQASLGFSAAERASARSELIGLLATISREAPNSSRTLVGIIDPSGAGAEDLLAALDGSGWVQLAPVDAALEEPARSAQLRDLEPSELESTLIEAVGTIHEGDAQVEAYAEIAEEPLALRVPFRLAALAALHVDASTNDQSLTTQITQFTSETTSLLDAVRILPGSDIHIVGSSVQLPVELVNELDVPADVVVQLRTLSPIVVVDRPQTEVTIAAGSSQRVLLPVEVVGSGRTSAVVTLLTASGTEISQPVTLRVEAQPMIETVLLWIGVAAVALLLGFGLWRSLRKRAHGEAAGDLDVAEMSRRTKTKESDAQ